MPPFLRQAAMSCLAVLGVAMLPACAPSERSFYEQDPGYADPINLRVAMDAQRRGDVDTAARAYTRILRNTGHPLAEMQLGRYYAEGQGVPKDPARAAELLQSAYAKQWPLRGFAAFYLGRLYEAGEGVPQDRQKAFELYRFSHARGERLPSFALARIYDEGELVPRDLPRARALYAEAAAVGDRRGDLRLAELMVEDGRPAADVHDRAAPAIIWLRELARADNDWAAFQLANIYRDGKIAPADPTLADRYVREAAKYGNATANARVAEREEAEGDSKAALSHWRRAADGGHPSGMVKVGFALLDSGRYADGLEWLKKAAALGHPSAMAEVGRRRLVGDGMDRRPEEGVDLLQKASAMGHPSAMYALGEAYANGSGVPEDREQARQWFERAAAAGHSRAQVALAELEV